MITKITKAERRVLLRFYREAFNDIADMLRDYALVSQRPRFEILLSDVGDRLRQLDSNASRWIRTHLRDLYRGNLSFVDRMIRRRGGQLRRMGLASQWAIVHDQVIEDLLLNPATGLGPRLRAISQQAQQTVEGYVRSHRTLLAQTRAMNQEIARGVLTGRHQGETVRAVLGALKNTRPDSAFGLPRDPVAGVYQSLLDMPFVRYADGRRMHIRDYVQMAVTTKESEVRNVARNRRLLERGIDLVQITPNPPLTPCVCSLYAGRVFSLTPEAEARTGHPLLASTPNGGPPFHPYCTHSTLPWIEELQSAKERELATATPLGHVGTSKGVPRGALTRDFKQARKYFESKGGIEWAVEQNPNLRAFGGHSSVTDPKVVRALGSGNKP